MPKEIIITTHDEVKLFAEVFGENNRIALVINPAIGIKRKMYHAFAEFMANQAVTTVLYNYRGMEDGFNDLSGDCRCDVEAWGRLDQSALIDWTKNELNPNQLLVLGHSIGGQLLGFANNSQMVDGLIHVAAQKGDKRLWALGGRLKLFLLWHLIIPWMSRGKVFNAKKLGLGNYPWPAAAAKQWASWGQQKDYLFNPMFGFDLAPWHAFDRPVLSFGLADDEMAPEAAIDGLLSEYGKNNDHVHIDKRIIDPQSLGLKTIGHFGFFKPKSKALWQDTETWIKQIQKNEIIAKHH
ncbi:MAG: alpha/beta hydrolase family protein [Marinicella sp.]